MATINQNYREMLDRLLKWRGSITLTEMFCKNCKIWNFQKRDKQAHLRTLYTDQVEKMEISNLSNTSKYLQVEMFSLYIFCISKKKNQNSLLRIPDQVHCFSVQRAARKRPGSGCLPQCEHICWTQKVRYRHTAVW